MNYRKKTLEKIGNNGMFFIFFWIFHLLKELELKQLQCKQQKQEMEFINKIFFDKLIKLDNDDDDKKSRESYRKKNREVH